MKTKYELSDTNYYIPREYSIHIEYTKDDKPFSHWISNIYLRIDRIVEGEIIETKYIVVSQNDSC